MITIKQVFYTLLGLNCLFVFIFFTNVGTRPESLTANTQAFTQSSELPTSQEDQRNPDDIDNGSTDAIQNDDNEKDEKYKDDSQPQPEKRSERDQHQRNRAALKKFKREIKKTSSALTQSYSRMDSLLKRRNKVEHALRWSNPFFLLGAYPRIGNEYFNSYPDGRPYYEKYNYGVNNDDNYCELVDLYNIAHPENMFESKNFFTDYSRTGLVRADVIRKIGVDTMREVSRYMDKKDFKSSQYHLTPIITNFFTKRVDLHIYHTIGKHFNCATQMYNHIPGHGVLKRKDLIVDSVDAYAAQFSRNGREHCFNKEKFFPYSYRLYIEKECKAFFKKINSAEYIKSLETEPLQFVIKLGYGAHRAKGVFIFDKNETEYWKGFYDNGHKCGIENKSLIAQTYITNPLLLDKNNKFDFRVYMLVASTNPLIVYYHDGFLRVSLEYYDKFSSDKSVHLTNTHLSKEKFAEAEANNSTINGMTAQELRDYQMWSFDRLGEHLYNSGKVTDRDWIETNLKPRFYEAFIHTVRMSAHAFWNQSNVYELFGLDFMLDDELNLWFIECNSSPQLIGTNDLKTKFLVQMLENLFEIQYGLYRSRMKRILGVLKEITQSNGKTDYSAWRGVYAEAAKNRFEPEFQTSPNNTFKLIMDMNIKGEAAFFDHLEDECAR